MKNLAEQPKKHKNKLLIVLFIILFYLLISVLIMENGEELNLTENERDEEKIQKNYEVYREWQDSGEAKQQIVIIAPESKNEEDLFIICDQINKETENEKRITVRGFTDKTAADDILYIEESASRLREFSDREIANMNYHAVLSFDKSLTTPLEYHQCDIYIEGFGNSKKTKEYGEKDYFRF